MKKTWTAQSGISIAKDPELLKLAVDSGCNGLLIGIESVLDAGLSKYSKNPGKFDELKETLTRLKDHGISVLAHMIFGNDFETMETFPETLERLKELDVASASLGIMIPYPGTKLAENMEKEGRIITRDWDYYDIHHLVFQPLNFSHEDFLKEMEKLRNDYFSFRDIMSRTMKYQDPKVFGFNIMQRSHNKVHHSLETDFA